MVDFLLIISIIVIFGGIGIYTGTRSGSNEKFEPGQSYENFSVRELFKDD